VKLSYRFTIEINRPLDEVISLFSNRTYLKKWQQGLVNSEPLPDVDGHQVFNLTYSLGRRKMKMTETIIRNELPGHYDVIYKLKGAQHTTLNSFEKSSKNTTKWNANVEYRFSGLMKIIARFMKSNFEQQSLGFMKSFKAYAEKR